MGEKEEEGKGIAWRCSPRTGANGEVAAGGRLGRRARPHGRGGTPALHRPREGVEEAPLDAWMLVAASASPVDSSVAANRRKTVPAAASSAWSGGGAGRSVARSSSGGAQEQGARGACGSLFIERDAARGVRRTHAEGGPAAAHLARPAARSGPDGLWRAWPAGPARAQAGWVGPQARPNPIE
jgi:hypothetical protein